MPARLEQRRVGNSVRASAPRFCDQLTSWSSRLLPFVSTPSSLRWSPDALGATEPPVLRTCWPEDCSKNTDKTSSLQERDQIVGRASRQVIGERCGRRANGGVNSAGLPPATTSHGSLRSSLNTWGFGLARRSRRSSQRTGQRPTTRAHRSREHRPRDLASSRHSRCPIMSDRREISGHRAVPVRNLAAVSGVLTIDEAILGGVTSQRRPAARDPLVASWSGDRAVAVGMASALSRPNPVSPYGA